MRKIVVLVLSFSMVIVMSACQHLEVSIEGSKNININEEHLYKAVVRSDNENLLPKAKAKAKAQFDKNGLPDAYQWEVISDSYEYQLSNETSSEVTFSASKGGKYILKVTVTKKRKTEVAEIEIIVDETIVVDGYPLPPMPDKKINDSTILGIDSNNNEVRDDVEIWIYTTYTEPIERGIFMQSARAYQKVIKDPSKAKETKKYLDAYTSCIKYWMFEAKNEHESFSIDKYRDLEKEIGAIQFNSIERHMAYQRYNAELSGGVYTLLPVLKSQCEFDEKGILKP